MELYQYIYYAVFVSVIFEIFSIKTKKIIMILWGIFFAFFAGLRWNTGHDWDQYYDHFLWSNWTNIFSYDRYGHGEETLEPGFVFINVAVKSIFRYFWAYNFIITAFSQFCIYKFCNYFFKNHPLFIYVIFIVFGYGVFMVRAGLAISVALLAWRYIKERNLKYFLLVAFSSLFIHYQCLILLPCYWIGKIKMKSSWLLILYPLIAVSAYVLKDFITAVMFSMSGSLAEKAYYYTQNETEGAAGASYIGWGLNYCFLLVYLYIRKVNKLYDNNWYNTLLNTVMMYNAIFMICSNGMQDLNRLSQAYFPAQVILLGSSVLYFANKQNIIIKMASILFYLSYILYKIPSNWSDYFFKEVCVPYKTIFDFNLI